MRVRARRDKNIGKPPEFRRPRTDFGLGYVGTESTDIDEVESERVCRGDQK